MTLKTIPLLLVMSMFWLPAIAQAQNIDLQSGNVRVSKDQKGNMYINTGNSRLRVPSNRSVNVNVPQSYRRINGCRSRNVTRQEITQVTRSHNSVIHTHSSNTQCY